MRQLWESGLFRLRSLRVGERLAGGLHEGEGDAHAETAQDIAPGDAGFYGHFAAPWFTLRNALLITRRVIIARRLGGLPSTGRVR